MPRKIRNKMRNKRCQLSSSADVPQEVAVNGSSQHSQVCDNSSQMVANPLSFTPCVLPEMDSPSAVSCSTGSGKNGKFNITDGVDNNSSHEIDCHQPPDDGDLLGAVNSESSYEAVALLTSEKTFTQDGLNQALLSACRQGHKLLVQTLIRVGANIEHRDEHGNTPLLICAENGFTDIVRFLVSRGAKVNPVNSVGNTALILSVRSAGSTDLTRFLLEQPDVNVHHENQHGHTALIRATQFMDVDTMRLLLERSMRKKPRKKCRKVVQRESGMDSCFFNNRSLEIKQQVTVGKTGLKGVYEILQEHLTARTSPLELAIKVGDTKSLDMFLDCQFSSREEKKRYVNSALNYVFQSQQCSKKRFSLTDVTIINKLLQCGADVNKSHENKLISLAVESGNFDVVELLCKHGADMKGHYTREEDPLVIAARIGHQDLIELLLKYKADIDRTDFKGSALDCALRNDHTECAKLLIQHGAKMYVKSALRSAIEHQVPKYMHFLLENYNCEIMDYFSQKPQEVRMFLTSAARQRNCDIIGQILNAGIDVNEADSTGQTPLMASKNRDVAEFLIQRGADVNREIEGKHGSDTALSYVIKNRECKDKCTVELCQVLIDNGALVNCRNGEGKTPLMLIAGQDECVDMLQMLLDNGADVNDKDSKGNTALVHAVRRDNSKYVTCLIDNGASVNCRSEDGETPLMMVADVDDTVDMLQILLDNGADANDKDSEGNTAIFYALRSENSKHIKCLVDCSRDKKTLIDVQDNEGITPLILSVQDGCDSIVKELLENGADANIKDNKENTALHHLLVLHDENIEEMLTCLLKAGSHVNWQNSDGLFPLMIAANKTMPSVVSSLLDAGADVNAVSKKYNSRSALSFLSDTFLSDFELNLGNNTRACFEILMDRGASCSYLRHECLHKLIIGNHSNIICKLIQHGVGPADVNKTQLKIGSSCVPSTVSPLCFALLLGNVPLARYFVDILFLTSSDLSMFASNKAMECILQKDHHKDSLRFLHELSSQPMSLVKLSLVAVSSAIGSSPGRETRVDSLPLPQMMKHRLLFKSVGEEHTTLTEIPSESNTIHDSARLVSLLKDLEILHDYDSDDEDYFFHSSDPSDSDNDSYGGYYDYR